MKHTFALLALAVTLSVRAAEGNQPPSPPSIGSELAKIATGNSAQTKPESAASTQQQTSGTNQASQGTKSSMPPVYGDEGQNPKQESSDLLRNKKIEDLNSSMKSGYISLVRRKGVANNEYTEVQVPAGWKLLPQSSLMFSAPQKLTLQNGDVYETKETPFVLVPASDALRFAVNPNALATLNNFYLAQLELMRNLQEKMQSRMVPE